MKVLCCRNYVQGYSAATDVLGHLIEVMSGQSFYRFFAEEILEPLGMEDTALT